MCDILCWPFAPPTKKTSKTFPPKSIQPTTAIPQTISKAREVVSCLEGRADRLQRQLHLDAIPRRMFHFVLFSSAIVGARYGYRRIHAWFWPRFQTADDVPKKYIAEKRLIKGRVTSVGDPDDFQLYHIPWPGRRTVVPTGKKELVNQTIHIRLAGIDAPEAGHFGGTPQEYSGEALAWLKDTIKGKDIYCELARRDQYKRIVADVYLPPRWIPSRLIYRAPSIFLYYRSRNVSLLMLRAGWAVVYEQANACYGIWGIESFKEIEEVAREEKLGIWQNGDDFETPAEYKARHKTKTPSPTIED